MSNVYINATGAFFPHAPIDNQAIEKVLGTTGRPSKSKSMILASNQIKTRHYAIDPESRQPTHTNAEMTALAVQNIFSERPDLNLQDTSLLCCGTSSPDLLVPSHGHMVQGHLPHWSGEVVTTAGVCCSSMAALKMAYLSVRGDECEAALVTGSEAASKHMRSEFQDGLGEAHGDHPRSTKAAFERDFLRWMLSDGAGAMYLSNQARPGGTNLKINWIEGRSYSNEQPVCMFAGGFRESNNELTAWKDLQTSDEHNGKSKNAMNVHQDVRLLRKEITNLTIERPLTEIKKKRGLRPGDYKWLLPHYSSDFFRQIMFDTLTKIDFQIPFDRWFTTLYHRGNVGSASMFVFINELLKTHQLSPGEKILCYVPESARFSVYYMELEVV